ncbi:prepilin-type N-terminal cleavage/methylation domain-containing protein [Kineococcus sp. SYSU DK005]|uniref:prepilin-type N-terminal cleavage/methylation domain-containing protein n=1 Tax=Kineococcus sp. SYSU DK005 TaxID=3383126 RepID=UPI003D7D8DA3
MRQPEPHPGRRGADEGFTLVEVVVSMLVFAVLSSAVLALTVKTLQTTDLASEKQVAANLAETKKEYLLGAEWDRVKSGADVVDASGAPVAAGSTGVAYTVTTKVTLVPSTDSACASNGADLTRKKVDVSVTWPGMRPQDLVSNETFRRVYQSDAASSPGSLGWQVDKPVRGSGGSWTYTGAAGVKGTLYRGTAVVATAVSDADGCMVFSGLDNAEYQAVVDVPGYLGQDNVQQQRRSGTVTAGRMTVVEPLRYAAAGQVQLQHQPVSAQYPAPASLGNWSGFGAVLYADAVSGYDERPLCTAVQNPLTTPCLGADGAVGLLYPAKTYAVYVGACADTKATTTEPTPSTAAPATAVPVKLGAVQYSVAKGTSVGALKVTAEHATHDSCTGHTVDLGTATVGTTYRVGLPLGTWTLRVTDTSTGASATTTTTATPTAPTTTTTLTAKK